MSPKKRGRKPTKRTWPGNHFVDPPLTDYELQWMRTCFHNNAKMRQLGLPVLATLFANTRIYPEIQQQKEAENSSSKYNGEDEPNSDGHLSDDGLELETELGYSIVSNLNMWIACSLHLMFISQSYKTTTKKNCAADVTVVTNQAEICNQPIKKADAGEQNGCLTRDKHIKTELNLSEAATMNDVNENGEIEGANVFEDDPFDEEDWMRGPNIGRELDSMTHLRKGKLPLVIESGKKRPNSVMIAAKFATECNIAVRNHVPIFSHWKEYKKHPKIIKGYIDRVGTKFHTDVKAAPMKKACVAMMKKAIHQQRYKLKKRYFDALPLHLVPKTSPVTSMTDEQWDKLVTCEKNRQNRSKVQFHQTTGSRSYEMQIVNLMHYSKKKGFAPAVQSLIVEMEKLNELVDDGLERKDVTDVVYKALVQKTKKNIFLVNVGLRSKGTCVSESDLEEELVVEKQTSSDLREVIKTQQQQMEEMMKKFEESETARVKQEGELKKKQADTDALIRPLMSMVPGCQAKW
uniref:Uncharacterized protein n=1 Tax=Setaria viridis TaxID=4556 RepID=A0A4U6U5W6_SETVI|nr:hypothetical protein SEVIR_6G113400v2 [Setaria viridis]